MSELQKAMEECERDTRETLGKGQASRLARWRQYAAEEQSLIQFIQRVIRGGKSENGFVLDQAGKLSLERIVLDRCPELFGDADKGIAKATLGLA